MTTKKLVVSRPSRLRQQHFATSPASNYQLAEIKTRLAQYLGREVSTSVVLRRAIEHYAAKVTRIDTRAKADRELTLVSRCAR